MIVRRLPDLSCLARAGTFALCVLVILCAGCSSQRQSLLPQPASSGPAQTVEQLHLLLTAVAVDMDGKPGPDGFGARLYASNRRSGDAPAITRGQLELLMFDGSFTSEQLKTAVPLKTWKFEPSELKARGHRTSIGMSYQFVLGWGESRPRKSLITILARYTPDKGVPVLSGPGTIPISLR